MSIGTFEIATSALLRWLGGAMIGSKATDVALEAAGKMIGVQIAPRQPIDQRLENIEIARISLTSALSAIDELKVEAERNAAQVETMKAELEAVLEKQQAAHGELSNIRKLADLDAAAVKKVMGVPTPQAVWLERIVSFIIGVLASVAASWVWSLLN